MKKGITIILVWVACGVINFGATMADFSHDFGYGADETPRVLDDVADPYATWREHLGKSLLFGALGPIGIIPVALTSNLYRHGLVYTVDGVRNMPGGMR